MKKKTFTLLLLAVVIDAVTFGQPVIKHQRTIGGSLDDNLICMDLTRDGGLIAGGYSSSDSSYEKTDSNRGKYYDYWVVKLNSLGKIEWDKTIGGSNEDRLTSLQQTTDGGYILGGYSSSNKSGEKTEDNRCECYDTTIDNHFDYWIVKLDSLGNIQWDRTIGGLRVDELYSLQQTSDGGYILGGGSWSDISWEKSENSRGNYDYWIVKLNSSGTIQWDKTIGGNSSDILRSIQQTSDNGYILGGESYSNTSYEKTQDSRGANDYWIVKLDKFGNIQWDKTIGGNSWDMLYTLKQTNDGGYILGGDSYSLVSGEKTEDRRGDYYDYWVVKLDSLSSIEWDKTIGGYREEYLRSIEQTSDGDYIIAGSSESNNGADKTENSRGYADYWIVKLGSLGKILADKTIGGNKPDALHSIKEIGKYHYVLGGSSQSGKSGDKTQLNRGFADYWLVEFIYRKPDTLQVTAQNANDIKAIENNDSKSFTLYPNPAKNILHIQTNSKATFTLTNQSGKILLTKTITNKGEINVAHLTAGFYYLKNNETGAVQKVIISK